MLWVIRRRVDSAHLGGSKRAAESKAALGEQYFRSSSDFSDYMILRGNEECNVPSGFDGLYW
jgi:hypothetical protein